MSSKGLIPEDLEVEVVRNFGTILIGHRVGHRTVKSFAALHLVLHLV